MAKRARKQRTEAERAEIEADRVAAHGEVKAQDQEIMRDELPEAIAEMVEEGGKAGDAPEAEFPHSPNELITGRGELPEGVTAVELNPTPEGIAIMERAIAEATGETNAMVEEHAPFMKEVEDEIEADALEKFMGDGEGDAVEVEEVKEPNSIVKDKFKVKYIENAKALGATSKAAKRSNWDWLSQQLAAACLSDKGKIEIGAFKDILDANGVDHSRWTNQNKGWEGRFRMTGRVALQKVVANNGKLLTPGGTEIEAPTEFIAKYKTKA